MKYKVNFELEFNRNPYNGKFIVLEGIDGSGKTTQVKILEKELKKIGYKVFLTKNPTNSFLGKIIRKVLSGEEKLPAQARQYLFCADRVVQQEDIISELKKGHVVVSDRYFWSSVAYGMADINKKDERLLTAYSILSFYNEFVLPDLTVFLDVDVNTAVKRFSTKEHKEIYEKKSFIEKVKDNYEFLLNKFPGEFWVVDSRRELKTVSEDIIKKIERILPISNTTNFK